MNTIYFDSKLSDDDRRQSLYQGQVFVFSPGPSAIALCDFAQQLVQEAFASLGSRGANAS